MSNLRSKLIRLAYENPELRKSLIPLLKPARVASNAVEELMKALDSILGYNVKRGAHKQPAERKGDVITIGYSTESGYPRSKFERRVREDVEYYDVAKSVSFVENDGYWIEAIIRLNQGL